MIVITRAQLKFLLAGRELTVPKGREREGRDYALGLNHRKQICRVLVVDIGETTMQIKLATVDRPRLLAAKSEYGYTDKPHRAMREEPEAIDAETQRRQTANAGAKRAADRATETASMPLSERLQALEASAAAGSSEARRDLHVIRQRLENAERKRARGT